MSRDKIASMSDAIADITAGSSVALGLALEHAIPFAAGHELIRQGISDLTLIGPISDVLFDQLIGAGLVEHIRAAWIGNVSTGTGHCFRRAVESDNLTVENHSNFSIALALKAAGMGVPYLPTRSLLGSDILKENNQFIETEDPFEGESVVLIPAIAPDWAIVHVQRADPYGDAHFWGNTGITHPAIEAADCVILTTEEIVEPSVIKSDPSRTSITRDQVTAVVEVPHGAHPSPVAGYYNRDNQYFLDYYKWTESHSAYEEWVTEWVYDVDSRAEYYEKVDADLSLSVDCPAAEVNYGQ
ncbi:CoA transferase subunit A [Haladaptatus halobius]|uniref:CoA transferase subunit A n=1 Tax=Haladaptatus halobius TaxID=2884875 RepID=UPI001D0AA1CE|nr:CoA-transferase [Haladaptatus halobius]